MAEFPWIAFLFALLLSAILSWGTTETIKRTFLARWKMHLADEDAAATNSTLARRWERERGWWVPLLWFVAVALGFGIGAAIWLVAGLSLLYGGLVGASGGALSAFLVRLLKRQSRKLADAAVGKVVRGLGLPDHIDCKEQLSAAEDCKEGTDD
jgi:Flp pilus assembly protein TadB